MLTGRDVFDGFDKTFEPERNNRYAAFILFDGSRRAHRHIENLALDLLGSHAGFLQLAEADADRPSLASSSS